MLLEDKVKRGVAKGRMTLPQLVDAMEEAGTQDLRGYVDLPLALRALGKPSDPALRDAIAKLRAWVKDGAHRRDKNRDGVYEHADAIRIMDAWWPLWVQAQFAPALGARAYKALAAASPIDNSPNGNGEHHGSSYQGSFYGYVSKDVRSVLGERVKGPYSRRYCGTLTRCRKALRSSLRAALRNKNPYTGDALCKDGDQWCYDAVRQRPTGGATQPLIHWINRPTYQQVNEIQKRLPR